MNKDNGTSKIVIIYAVLGCTWIYFSDTEKTVTVQYRHIHKTRGWVFSEAIAQSFLDESTINGVIREQEKEDNRVEQLSLFK
jgi:hypothetical protein